MNSNPFQALWNLLHSFLRYPSWIAYVLLPVACIIAAAFADPEGAINTFLIKAINILFQFWPSTPDDKKLWFLIDKFALAFPNIGMGPIYEILQGVFGVLGLVLFFKLIKTLPFI